jgi:SAM-dependent methyltransferase
MEPSPSSLSPTPGLSEPRLRDTQHAFDSVAADYDGPRGNNPLIQDMREEMWRWLDATFAPASRLIDIGCGTGLDAVRMARLGHEVTATDWSARMVQRTHDRAARERLQGCVQAIAVGAQRFSGIAGGAATTAPIPISVHSIACPTWPSYRASARGWSSPAAHWCSA